MYMNSPVFIIIDGSFFCYNRFFSLQSKKNTNINVNSNPEFVKTSFIEKLHQLPHKLNIHNVKPILIVGKDCPRKDIWRHDIYKHYKTSRKQIADIRPFINMVYNDKLFEKAGTSKILMHPRLEADDCIALYARHLIGLYPMCKIYIVTEDKDYIQLSGPQIKIINLECKEITEYELQLKILMGDKSDNIPSVFPKCGFKTAQKCIQDPEYFKLKMGNIKQYYDQYKLNNILINFAHIPNKYKKEFLDNNC